MIYNHTQKGYLMWGIFAALLVFFGVLWNLESDSFSKVIMVIVLFVIASFSFLSVRIDKTHLRIKFGYGMFSKKFLLKEIKSVVVVRNKWYYGWGIRLRAFPKMWIYNVSGFDAVEIELKNGKLYRIGTDQPKLLEKAIHNVIK